MALIVLTACVPFSRVCTAIGYTTALIVQPKSPASDLRLELCTEPGCTPGAATPDVHITGDGVEGWNVVFFSGSAETVGYRITDATDTVISEGAVEPDWVRVSGTEECGGNTEARVTL